MQNDIKLIRHFHHRSMAALVNEIKLAVRNKTVKLPCYKWRSDGVIIAPY
jgi:hypothetical protein